MRNRSFCTKKKDENLQQYRNQPNKKSVSYQFHKQFILSPKECCSLPNSIETNKKYEKVKAASPQEQLLFIETKFLSLKVLCVVIYLCSLSKYLQEILEL